ncbi:MAG TPA: alkaline phosphatase D family protein [Acidimicrobiales bacterium]|nr:alkaline phosphatase D family protein [Acidimicrobiales bacterium]
MPTSEPTDGGGAVIDRRTFLAGVVATALAAGCSGDGGDGDAPTGVVGEDVPPETAVDMPPLPSSLPAELFALGVASGDPLPDSVVLWTRLVNDPLAADGGLPDQPLPVRWEMAAGRAFDDVVASGDVVAEPALAHSVHVDASGLEPGRWYWYRFSVGGSVSPTGRTRTAPASAGEVDGLRFAMASCQSFQDGYFTALDHLAAEDVDLVMFLGDYIYEEGPESSNVRTYEGEAPIDLAGYRRRFGECKRDPALQAAHARAPWVCTWDDHEVENNYADGVPDAEGRVGPEGFGARRAAAYQAYYEHMPVRIEPPDGAEVTLYRSVDWGDLVRFYVLDGRQYRDDQACETYADIGVSCDEVTADDRTMLGAEQEAWLGDELAGSDATWNVLAQQTVMTKLTVTLGDIEALNLDQWDGYPEARRRVVDLLREVDNPLVISGDIHAGGVGQVTDDPDDVTTAPLVPEVVSPSISSVFPTGLADIVASVVDASPNVHYAEPNRHGYVLCDVTPEAVEATFRYVSTTAGPRAEIADGPRWVVRDGDPRPRRAD